MPDDDELQSLVESALAIRDRAYAPYSNYRVGAALWTANGRIITGTNVENASYGLTICAERAAVFAAVTQGERDFQALAVATRGGGSPCGACRQVLSEFTEDLLVLIVDSDRPDQYRVTNLAALLPDRFRSSGGRCGE